MKYSDVICDEVGTVNYQETAIKSAEIYYQYLTDHDLGSDKIAVLNIESKGECCILTLFGKLKYPDAVEIEISKNKYTWEQMKPIEYDKLRRTLKVLCPLQKHFNELARANYRDVLVVSDLRFLVKRVEDWYRAYGANLELPVESPRMEDGHFDVPGQTLSDHQRDAIRGALSTPLSYIWGAPGTGKTQFVLARCILAYIRSGKRVLITAPTNNAVEQTLYGVLSVLENSDVPMNKILRLGIPSFEFASKYPALCEDTEAVRRISEIDEQIINIDRKINENYHLIQSLPKYQEFVDFEMKFSVCEQELPSLLEKLGAYYKEYMKIYYIMELRKGNEHIANDNLKQSEKENGQIAKQIEALNSQINKFQSGIWRWLKPKQYGKLIEQLKIVLKSAARSDEECEKYRKTTEDIASKIEDLKNQMEDISDTAKVCKEQMGAVTVFWPELHERVTHISASTFEAQCQFIKDALTGKRLRLDRQSATYAPLRGATETELRCREESLKKSKEEFILRRINIKANSTSVKMENCQVLAGTIDTCLYRLTSSDDFKPDHVFLDEAAYCSLIKGATLLAYHCSVTLLGDHMQLPPVCEMKDGLFNTEKYKPVCLWAQSVLYLEDIFTESIDELSNDHKQRRPPYFQKIKKFDLTHSYRFGEALGRVLATCVYSKDFHGDKDHDTDIFYINVQREKDHQPRTNVNECNAINEYLSLSNEDSVGIITPYRNQKRALLQKFGFHSDLDILTVHGSQGREWDTVLFSVVDRDDKWLTNACSPISNGKCIINTAVSRARKKLILVCDTEYWFTQHKQLIGQLLSVATEINEKHTREK